MDKTNMSAEQFEDLGRSLSAGRTPGDTVTVFGVSGWRYSEDFATVLAYEYPFVRVRLDNGRELWVREGDIRA